MTTNMPGSKAFFSKSSWYVRPFVWIELKLEVFADWVGRLAVFRILEYAGRLTIVVALLVWLFGFAERHQAEVRAAWSLLNSSGGGRLEALQYLATQEIDLRGTDGSDGYFGAIDLGGEDLRWSDFSQANLDDAILNGADLRGVRLEGASLDGATLNGADLREVRLESTELNSISAARANLAGVSIKDVYIGRSPMYGADLRETNLSNLTFFETNLQGSVFIQSRIDETEFYSTMLGYSDFSSSFLHNVSFQNSDLTNSDFRGATFRSVPPDAFRGAILTGVNFTGVRLADGQLEQFADMLSVSEGWHNATFDPDLRELLEDRLNRDGDGRAY